MKHEHNYSVVRARASNQQVQQFQDSGRAGVARARPHVLILRWLFLSGVVCLWIAIFFIRQPADGLGTDFYPLHRAGQALLVGINPYGSALTDEFIRAWHVPYAAAGFAYPLAAVVGVWPILLLPLPLAILVWVVAGTVGSAAAIRLRSDWRSLLLLPFCFMPLHGAVIMKQATLIWFALIVLLLFAMRWENAWLAGLCIVLLPAKPQVGILFALAGLVWAWRYHRRTFLWIGAWGALIWGGSFLLQPYWVTDWLASITRYNRIVYTASLLPWGLVLFLTTWRLPWYARLGVAQVILFPVTDAYSALPLLLAWVGIGGPLALLGSGISWLGVLAGLPNTIVVFWAVVMVPLIACSGWSWYLGARTRTTPDATQSKIDM
jgi:hypothetical protein